MSLDTYTVLLLLVTGNLLVFLYLLIYILTTRTQNSVVTTYVLAKFLLITSYLLMYNREFFPEKFSIVVSNAIVFFGVALEVFCTVTLWRPFSRRNLIIYLTPALIFSIVFSFFIGQPANVRIAVASFLPASYFLWGGIALFFFDHKYGIKYFMAFFYSLTAIAFFGRMYAAAFQDAEITIYGDTGIQLASYVLLLFLGQLGTIYLLMALKEQDEDKILEINKVINEDNLLLKELNAVKDKFFSIIAHDLKTPIGSLSQLLGVLAEQDKQMDPERRQRLLDTVHRNSKSTYHLLNNLLLWARSQSRQIRFEPSEIQLNELIEENIRIIKGGAEVKNISIENLCSRCMVIADHDMLDAVIRNIFSNAVKFTKSGGKIIIKCEILSEGMIKVEVRDTGTGINEEVLPNLLGIDSEFVMPGTNQEKGSGLGLKLCKEFVEKNGGTIWLSSILGKGTTVSFSIPLALQTVSY
ncbi:MAG: HAMP domain-containing histidine kinase [Bacteroidales bacterium]|nr:HAMP domain-containing histidine kinase [Bacteroidales bacterium]